MAITDRLLDALEWVESRGNPRAVNPKSGAAGAYQFMPATAREFGIDPFDRNASREAARKYLAQMLPQFGGDVVKTLQAYNWGPGNMRAFVETGRGVKGQPMPEETRKYPGLVQSRMGGDVKESGIKLVAVEGDPFGEKSEGPRLVAVEGDPFAVQPDAPAKPARSRGQELGRQVGLAARYGVEGASALPAMVADLPGRLYNLAATGVDRLAGTNLPRAPLASESIPGLLTRAGVPEPESAQERVVGDVTRAMSGAGAIVKGSQAVANVAAPAVRGLASRLALGPGTQVASAASGSAAAGITRESGGDTGAQIAAGILGGAAPSFTLTGFDAARRGLLRGGEEGRQRVAENIKTFSAAGDFPTVGQATETRTARGLESALSKTPGGAGPMAAKAETQAANVGARVGQTMREVAPGMTSERAGRVIEQGVTGPGGFVERFKAESKRLYDALDEHIPKQRAVNIGNTREALADLTADIPNAPALSQWFKNARIQGIEGALVDDLTPRPGTTQYGAGPAGKSPPLEALPYEAIKKLRTLVGQEMASPSLTSNVPRSQWEKLYGALSRDLDGAASAASPQAKQALDRANRYYSAGMDRIGRLDPVVKQVDPEMVYRSAINGANEGSSRLRTVLQSLQPQEQRGVIANLVQRLGRATPGRQNELGEVFSTESFLTNWNRLAPEVRQLVLDRMGAKGPREVLQAAAKVAANVREGSKVFANPSGTGQVGVGLSIGGTGLGGLLTGNPLLLAGAAATPFIANRAARWMTDPNSVRFLAERTQMNPAIAPALAGLLAQQ